MLPTSNISLLLLTGNINKEAMVQENKILKDREATEKKILDAVGTIIAEEGFEKIGINAVSQKAEVSKILVYRYFGSIEQLIAQYICRKDFWINITVEPGKIDDTGRFIKEMFRKQISQLRHDVTLKRLYRWELSTNNPITKEIRAKRETNGYWLVDAMSRLTNSPVKEVASLATIISSSISYLALLEELNPIYNGINIQTDEGWQQIADGIDLIVDLWIKSKEQ